MIDPFRNPLKTRLGEGQPCVGAWLSSGSPVNAEAMASMGFHWLCVDMEHGSTDISQVEAVFVAAERHGAAPVARLGSLDGHLARRLLDLGAAGIIVAGVEDASAFEAFAKHCFYGPDGHRGVGLSRCNKWGDTFEDYKAGFRPVLVPMIETVAGVKAAGDLAALKEVDALFLGPYDLSSDLGAAGDFNAIPYKESVERVRQACADNAKAAGIHQVAPDKKELQARIDEGFGLLAYGTDVIAMRQALSGIKELKGMP
ncbi:MAG: hypothetical protein HQ494_06940 [Rhodospirillales bacterium]|nr:hypothetical protein [Rhodospirillales bacterium]